MERSKWTERTFTFDFPEGWLPNILERLRGTSIRITEISGFVSDDDASYKPHGKWSIKENIGHLNDLESLHEGRIDDFIERKEILRAADMQNIQTEQANHNSKSVQQLLLDFIHKRKQFITRLEQLDDDTQHSRSLHPRLKIAMRPVDLAYFTAEHDDHHLVDMRAILNLLNKVR
jgi:hypothetical protein